ARGVVRARPRARPRGSARSRRDDRRVAWNCRSAAAVGTRRLRDAERPWHHHRSRRRAGGTAGTARARRRGPALTVLVYVQHLLGIGHLMRARLIAEALADRGFDVHLVSGGITIRGGPPRVGAHAHT